MPISATSVQPILIKPFALADVEAAVTQVAVSVLQARGEPASAERLLGEVLIGLDQLGHLRRLVATQTFTDTEAAAGGADRPAQRSPNRTRNQSRETDAAGRTGLDHRSAGQLGPGRSRSRHRTGHSAPPRRPTTSAC